MIILSSCSTSAERLEPMRDARVAKATTDSAFVDACEVISGENQSLHDAVDYHPATRPRSDGPKLSALRALCDYRPAIRLTSGLI
jgi:hypothetical protein